MAVESEPLEHAPEDATMEIASRVGEREAVFAATSPGGEEVVTLGGGQVRVSKPSGSRDDVTEVSLDLEETYAGMLRELAALESLSVGDLISESELPPKKRVISTRWVVADKRERVDGKEKRLVRCRVVARDFAAGLSAAQLGLSSPTASAEALKIFLAYAGAVGNNILGLDVSTAFLFAELIGEEIIIMLPDGCRGLNGELLFMRLRKALYGLRSASLHWTRHLSRLLKKMFNMTPCETEACLFAGTYKQHKVLILAYVDDILITCSSDQVMHEMIGRLRGELKLKVTAELDKDKKIVFLGRNIVRTEVGGDIHFGMDESYIADVLGEYQLENAKPQPTPPSLRDMFDKAIDDPTEQAR